MLAPQRFGKGIAARRPVVRLVTVGAVITWVSASVAAHLVFHEPLRVSVLIGAILVVSGPTVVGPLLRLARPSDPSATILRWEGILIDPIGAVLGLFCLNAFFIEGVTVEEVWGELLAPAVAGALVLFPAWLFHQVRPYIGNAQRISIAFNLSV